MKLAVLWESCGPYHFSRLETLRRLAGAEAVIALELSSQNSTYAWRQENRETNQVISLFPDQSAEKVRLVTLFKKMRALLRVHKVDVLFVPSYWPAYSLVSALAAKSVGVRIVFMGDSHYASGTNHGVALIIKRFLLRLYDSAFVAGSLHRSFLRHLGMPADKIFDGYDTVDNDHFSKIAGEARINKLKYRSELGLPQKYILSLGRFVPKKNLESVVKAYADLVARSAHHGHDLVFVGSGPLKQHLVALAKTLGLEVVEHSLELEVHSSKLQADREAIGTVHFYPFAQIETVPVFYALATAFILASTTDEWGLVVNEAMASGCPVVVSRSVGSSLDLVIPEKTGYRFVADNTHEIAWCLEKLCGDLNYAKQLGFQAQVYIGDWSNDRFARNALLAAHAALGTKADSLGLGAKSLELGVVSKELKINSSQLMAPRPSVWFLQTCFPDYRMPVFQVLQQRLGNRFHLFSGMRFFTDDIKMCPDFFDWHSLIENRFLVRRRLLWQSGACEAMFHGDVVVIELNPRVVSNWVILAVRSLWGAPTLLWGHAWGRGDAHSFRNVLRLYMMRMASATITYTRTQRKEVRRVFPGFRVFAATNSLIREDECLPLSVAAAELDSILYVGRIITAKKVQLLIEGFSLAKLPAQVKLKLVGSGSDQACLVQRVAGMGKFSERIHFLGHVQNHELLKSVYSTSFCAVSPGYVGLGAIQSFSFGVPLVLADKEPHAPEVEACSADNTVYFEANNVSALAKTLERMWDDRVNWLGKRTQLAEWTAEHYSVEAMVDGFEQAIDAVSGAVGARV